MRRAPRAPRPFILVGIVAGLLAAGCVQVYPPPATAPSPQTAAAAGAGADSTKDEEKSPFQPWDEVLKDTEEIDGYLTLHLKRDRTVFLELPTDALDRDFGLVMHFSRGAGDFNLQQGLPVGGTRLVRLERAGDKVYLVHRNPRFTAEEGSPIREALDANLGHSILAAFDIKSRHEDTGALLVELTPFLVSDYPGLTNRLEAYYGQGVSLDEGRSRVERILGFPRNVEIDALLTYGSSRVPQAGGFGVSDWRSVPVGVRYSFFALPETPMTPRHGDDRVGHFLTALWDFSRDTEAEPWVRYVSRWRLEKADPTAEISEPVEPIVFYVDRSVPERYRPYVKEGIEAWNRAFAAAGFREAIVARDPPADDPDWSAEDIRYSTIRWTPAYGMNYAIGPSQADPRTGEILNADVLISANFTRFWQLEYEEVVGPAAGAAAGPGTGIGPPEGQAVETRAGAAAGPGAYRATWIERNRELERLQRTLEPGSAERLCFAELGKAHQLRLGHALLAGLGELPVGEMPEEYVGDAIRDLVMHEVGHAIGLRHNFKASSGIPHERLHDPDYTAEHGVTLSVMDYGPVNVSPNRDRQGHYWNRTVGTYDVWAVRYAYATVYEQPEAGPLVPAGTPVRDPEAELVGLRKIASEVADPRHTYGTDEDNWLGSFAVDPLTNAWDLGGDPLAHARDRAALVGAVKPRLLDRLVGEGDRYARLRGATTSLIVERFVSLMPITKQVGGLLFHRDHRGDPGERPPFVQVAPERQREAVDFIVDQAFRENSFAFDPELLNRLAPNRFSHWGTGFVQLPVDYPVHSYVLLVQRGLLEELLAPPRLWRLIDNEVRTPAGQRPYRASELFETLTQAIWSELGRAGAARPATSFRRNLQRAHLERLTELLLDTAGGFPTAATPEDGRSLARRELRELSGRIGEALRAEGPDAMTRAHLEESKARIDRALEASLHFRVRER